MGGAWDAGQWGIVDVCWGQIDVGCGHTDMVRIPSEQLFSFSMERDAQVCCITLL